MKTYTSNEIRNIAILGHSGCGKTTLVEAMLYEAGIINRMGKVDEGNTVSDYDPEETKRHVSISSSVIPLEWMDTKINFIDTPGYFDFVGEVKQALSVADAAIIVVSAKSGNEVGTEKAWQYVEELGIPRMVVINGMDDENANFDNVMQSLTDIYGKSIVPFQIPFFTDEGKFKGFINAIKREAKTMIDGKYQECPIPEKKVDQLEEARAALVEVAAEADEVLIEKYFADEELSLDEIYSGLNKGILDCNVTPVIGTVATMGIGITTVLNALIKAFPSSLQVHPSIEGTNPKTNGTFTRENKDSEPLSAFVFKTIADPYIGRLNLFRVFSGIIKADSQVYNANKDIMEKIGRLYVIRGKEQTEVAELHAGDIGAVAKLANTGTQDTLCAKDMPIILPTIKFPESLMSMAIVPKTKGDEDKISSSLTKIMEEDPTIKMEINAETKQNLVYGIGEQHLDILVNKLKNKYKIEVDLHAPIFPYREMIKSKIKVQGKYKKQSGGHGQYGDVHIEFEPSGDLTRQFIFEEKIFGGSVPRQYFPAVEKGLQDSINNGVLAGYPVVGLKATLVDGSYHPVDSSEMAFKMATQMAFKDGLAKAKPTLLEPIAKVSVTVPDDYMGDVIGDLNKRRGRILGMNPVNGKQVIEAEVPMAEMFKYSTDLRSMTQSRGEFTLSFERYEEAPMDVQLKIIEERKKAKE